MDKRYFYLQDNFLLCQLSRNYLNKYKGMSKCISKQFVQIKLSRSTAAYQKVEVCPLLPGFVEGNKTNSLIWAFCFPNRQNLFVQAVVIRSLLAQNVSRLKIRVCNFVTNTKHYKSRYELGTVRFSKKNHIDFSIDCKVFFFFLIL